MEDAGDIDFVVAEAVDGCAAHAANGHGVETDMVLAL